MTFKKLSGIFVIALGFLASGQGNPAQAENCSILQGKRFCVGDKIFTSYIDTVIGLHVLGIQAQRNIYMTRIAGFNTDGTLKIVAGGGHTLNRGLDEIVALNELDERSCTDLPNKVCACNRLVPYGQKNTQRIFAGLKNDQVARLKTGSDVIFLGSRKFPNASFTTLMKEVDLGPVKFEHAKASDLDLRNMGAQETNCLSPANLVPAAAGGISPVSFQPNHVTGI